MEKTLRDEIAIAAMHSIIIGMAIRDAPADGDPYNIFWSEVLDEHGTTDRSTITENAYEIADAFLRTRNNEPQPPSRVRMWEIEAGKKDKDDK